MDEILELEDFRSEILGIPYVWCAHHMEEYMHTLNRNNPELRTQTVLSVIDAALKHPEFPKTGTEAQLNAALSRRGPLCCYVGDPALRLIRDLQKRTK